MIYIFLIMSLIISASSFSVKAAQNYEAEDYVSLKSCWNDVQVDSPGNVRFSGAGCSVERVVIGDLDGDETPDIVLMLHRECRSAEQVDCDQERDRGIFVALEVDGGYKKIAFSSSLLRCSTCYGAIVAGFPGEVKIDDGQLIVDQLWGSRETERLVNHFRLDSENKRMVLAHQERTMEDRLSGRYQKEISDFTSRSVTVTSGHFDKEQQRYIEESKRVENLDSKQILLEDVDVLK